MFSIDNFLYTLPFALKGMVGIFVVISAIIASVYLLNYFTNIKK